MRRILATTEREPRRECSEDVNSLSFLPLLRQLPSMQFHDVYIVSWNPKIIRTLSLPWAKGRTLFCVFPHKSMPLLNNCLSHTLGHVSPQPLPTQQKSHKPSPWTRLLWSWSTSRQARVPPGFISHMRTSATSFSDTPIAR